MKKTKNYMKYKKIYLVGDGYKRAPFELVLTYNGYDLEFDRKLEELANRNTGIETGAGYGCESDERDISYDFFNEKGLKQFIRKIKTRYKNAFVDISVTQYSLIFNSDDYFL